MTNDEINLAIATNLEVLQKLLLDAATRSAEASAAINQGERNTAIGCLLGLEEILANATALYRAAISLHCIKH